MEAVITILERKNLCFKNFHKLCSDFVDEIAKGETQNLEQFQRRRQALIHVLEQLEEDLIEKLKTIPTQTASVEKTQIETLLKEKDSILNSILSLDAQILSHIDRVKDETIKKLQALQSGRKTIGAYRSPMTSIDSKPSVDGEA